MCLNSCGVELSGFFNVNTPAQGICIGVCNADQGCVAIRFCAQCIPKGCTVYGTLDNPGGWDELESDGMGAAKGSSGQNDDGLCKVKA